MNARRSGVGLTEAIVALALFAVVLTALLPGFTNQYRANTTNELRTGAVAVAQQQLDNLRAASTWPATGTVDTVTTGTATYEAVLRYERFCEGATCYPGARHVIMEVRHNGRALYRVETVFTMLDDTSA